MVSCLEWHSPTFMASSILQLPSPAPATQWPPISTLLSSVPCLRTHWSTLALDRVGPLLLPPSYHLFLLPFLVTLNSVIQRLPYAIHLLANLGMGLPPLFLNLLPVHIPSYTTTLQQILILPTQTAHLNLPTALHLHPLQPWALLFPLLFSLLLLTLQFWGPHLLHVLAHLS